MYTLKIENFTLWCASSYSPRRIPSVRGRLRMETYHIPCFFLVIRRQWLTGTRDGRRGGGRVLLSISSNGIDIDKVDPVRIAASRLEYRLLHFLLLLLCR